MRLRARAGEHPTFRRQHPVGPYVLDFYCADARLCVEVDGAFHHVGDRPQRDARRDAWLNGQGIEVVRIPAWWVLDDPGAVAEQMRALALERKGANRRV